MMLVAFAALALAVFATPLVGFGALILGFLVVCAVVLLAMVRYGRQNQAMIAMSGDRTDGPRPGGPSR